MSYKLVYENTAIPTEAWTGPYSSKRLRL